MPCLFVVIAGFAPRLGSLIIWLARPQLYSAAFGGSWLVPLLGIIFLPFTTLMYALLWRAGMGMSTWDWIWLVMAVFVDLMHYSSTTYNGYNGYKGYTSQSEMPSYNRPVV